MGTTFVKGALQGVIFGPLYAIIVWIIASAGLSLVVLFASVLLTWNGVGQLTLDQLLTWDTSTLTSLPLFSTLGYVQILWAGLLVFIILGGVWYVIVLAQGTANEKRVVDFFHNVAVGSIQIAVIVIAGWIFVGLFYAFFFNSAILHDPNSPVYGFWTSFEQNATLGLQKLGMDVVNNEIDYIMVNYYKYFPIPILFVLYVYMALSIHGGWLGR